MGSLREFLERLIAQQDEIAARMDPGTP